MDWYWKRKAKTSNCGNCFKISIFSFAGVMKIFQRTQLREPLSLIADFPVAVLNCWHCSLSAHVPFICTSVRVCDQLLFYSSLSNRMLNCANAVSKGLLSERNSLCACAVDCPNYWGALTGTQDKVLLSSRKPQVKSFILCY